MGPSDTAPTPSGNPLDHLPDRTPDGLPDRPPDRLPDGGPLPPADRIEALDRVVIVGAGPVGMCTALTLARLGVPVTVLEKGPGLSAESRASTFHPPTLELLADLGVADEVIARGLKAPTTQFRDRALGPIAEFDLGVLAGDTEFPFRIQLEQNKLAELVLATLEAEAALGELDAEVRFGWRAHAVISHSGTAQGNGTLDTALDGSSDRSSDTGLGGVSDVRLLVGTAEELVEVRAPWVIACDGAHSPVRESLGLELVGETYPERFLVASVDEEIKDHLPVLAHVNYIADPDEWMVLLRTPDHWRVLFPVTEARADADRTDRATTNLAAADPATTDPLTTNLAAADRVPADGKQGFTEADVQARLTGVVDLGRPWKVLQWSLYVVSRRVAARMRIDRVLLAGDAGHQNSPLGGMGMNSGIQDGVSAARRLAAVWHGEADESVLDEYDENRRRVATEYVQADSHANWLALREPDPVKRAELQADLRATAADPERHRARVERSAMIDATRAAL